MARVRSPGGGTAAARDRVRWGRREGPAGRLSARPRATAAVSRTPDATGKPVIDAAPARLPATRQSALDLIGRGIADPDDFGPGVVARRPYESGPDTWPVLGTDCVWQQAEPGSGVLTTLTRSVEVPAGQNARAEPADVAVTAKGAKGWMDARIGDLGVRAQSAGFTGSRVSTGPVLAPAFLRRPGRSPGVSVRPGVQRPVGGPGREGDGPASWGPAPRSEPGPPRAGRGNRPDGMKRIFGRA